MAKSSRDDDMDELFAWDEVDEEDDVLDDDPDDDDRQADDVQDVDDDSDDVEADSDAAAVVETEEDARPVAPDDVNCLTQLRKLGARLDRDESGKVWRIIFYDRNTPDDVLILMHGLRRLKEVWLLGTEVSKSAIEDLKVEMPWVKVYK